jgi:copper/silver efflux system protein
VLALAVLGATALPAMKLGSEFMPTLNEGTLLFMPVSLPGLSVTKAAELLQTQDRIIKSFPEVESVFGKAGRAATATDPAPVEMSETVVNLKPESQWRPGVTIDSLIAEMGRALEMPGVSSAWTMPIKARIDMLSTGIRTPVGIKVCGPDLAGLDPVSREVEAVVRQVSGTTSAFAERIEGGYFLEIEPDRAALARYGLTVGDLQETITTALGGESVTTTVDGRARYTVNVRYARGLRTTPDAIARQVLVQAAQGAAIPLGQLVTVRITRGPATIRTENAQLVNYIYVDTRDSDIGGYVTKAQRAVAEGVRMPPGYHAEWSGQFEYMQRAKARMTIVVPVTLLVIFVLLYLNFGRLTETLIVMLSVPFALIGGIWLMYLLGFNISVAAVVGFIALAGVAAETGVIMLIYLDHALSERRERAQLEGRAMTRGDLRQAIIAGAVERVRPKMMTVTAIMAGLLPILWSTGTGSELMRRIAAPMVGGMISSADSPGW